MPPHWRPGNGECGHRPGLSGDDCEIYLKGKAAHQQFKPYIFSSGINGMPTTDDASKPAPTTGFLPVMIGRHRPDYATYFGADVGEHVDGGTCV